MRKTLFVEGEVMPNGMYISKGSIQYEDAPFYPLTEDMINYRLVGKIRDIRREENGAITGEIEIVNDEWKLRDPELKDFDVSFYCADVVMGPNKVLVSARARGATLVPIPAVMDDV